MCIDVHKCCCYRRLVYQQLLGSAINVLYWSAQTSAGSETKQVNRQPVMRAAANFAIRHSSLLHEDLLQHRPS